MNYSFSVFQIHIITTNRCNLQCSYCYESNKFAQDADISKIKKCLENEFETKCYNYTRFLVTFHGGEPFLAFNVIESICAWIWDKYSYLKIDVNVITNGTILPLHVKQWIVKNRHRAVVILSLDGLPEVHNRNRCNSFSKIDVEFFKKVYRRPFAKMTVPPDSVKYMSRGFEYLNKLGYNTSLTMAAEENFDAGCLRVLSSELMKIINYYKLNPYLPITELFEVPFERMSANCVSPIGICHRCGIGNSRSAYDVYGNRYPCQTFISDFSRLYCEAEYDKITTQLKKHWSELLPKCVECPIAPLCSPCYGLNYANRGDITNIDYHACKLQKIIVKASAYLWAYLLLNQTPQVSDIPLPLQKLKFEGISLISKLL